MEDSQVEESQSVREDEVLKDPSDFSAHIKNVVSDGKLLRFSILALGPAPAQEINDVCQCGQKYGNEHHVAIVKVVHLKLDSDKKRRHFGDIGVGFGPSKVDLIVAVGVLETVKGHNAGLGTA